MNFYTKLLNRGVLQLAGSDTRAFLQGQTTCDFDQLSLNQSLKGAHCTPQGRVVCDFRAIALNDADCLLSMDRHICAGSAAVLGKYIVFSKSDIWVASDAWAVLAVWGDELDNLENNIDDSGAIWTQVDEAGKRWECYCPAESLDTVIEMIEHSAEAVPESDWQLEEINAGLGHIEIATVEMFIPQMLNYQATGHVNFTKGCYTGQEVVARMHYRGKLKRPMYIAQVDAEKTVAGAPLFKPGSEQSVGNIVNAVNTGSGTRVLAVCTTDSVNEGVVKLGAIDGADLAFLPLPYSLESDD